MLVETAEGTEPFSFGPMTAFSEGICIEEPELELNVAVSLLVLFTAALATINATPFPSITWVKFPSVLLLTLTPLTSAFPALPIPPNVFLAISAVF